MLKPGAKKRWSVCAQCRVFDEMIGQSGCRALYCGVPISRTSLHEDCISCVTLSHYFRDSNATEVVFFLRVHYQIENRMTPPEAMTKVPCFQDTETTNLISIDMCDSANRSQRYTLVPEEHSNPGPKGERVCGSVVDIGSANLARAKKWIESCRVDHASDDNAFGKACAVSPVRMKIPLKIVDCRTLRVRTLLPNESYICLSYVWGSRCPAKVPVNQQLDASIIPKTISDAIYLAEQLGIPRLWVDQYCIDQEDKDRRHESIASMHLIYGSAEVTIVAACGTDASHGLPGILGTKRMYQTHPYAALGSRNFTKHINIHEQVKQTRWHSRGWTFQEALLSARVLVFTESQMYFQCSKMHSLEYLMDGLEIDNLAIRPDVFPTWGIGRGASEVYRRIVEYFPRELSFDTDNLKAIEGILEAFGGAQLDPWRVRHFYGTPLLYEIRDKSGETFKGVKGLTWWVSSDDSDAEKNKNFGYFDSGLPSWTWASRKSARLSSKRGLHFECTDPQLDIARNVEFHITERGGERVSLFHYAITGSKRYSEFHPWIDITTLTIQGRITRWSSENTTRLIFAGMKNAFFDLDHTLQDTEEITAILLGACVRDLKGVRYPVYFLLVQPAASGAFSRIGLLSLYSKDIVSRPLEFIENPKEALQTQGLDDDATVERKTLRIV